VAAARAVSKVLIFRPKHSAVHTKRSSTLASLAIAIEIGLVATMRLDCEPNHKYEIAWLRGSDQPSQSILGWLLTTLNAQSRLFLKNSAVARRTPRGVAQLDGVLSMNMLLNVFRLQRGSR
jgi:hypothetical protein